MSKQLSIFLFLLVLSAVFAQPPQQLHQPTGPTITDERASAMVTQYVYAMFGQLGVVQIPCWFEHDEAVALYCGETTSSFRSFQSGWDLYSDWTQYVPIVPTPMIPWQLTENSVYGRSYVYEDFIITVLFDDGLIIVGVYDL
jgi:hypothetical protein